MASKYEDVKSLPVAELRKRLDQQRRLLQNRALLSGLPDGGERVRRKVAELESALSSKQCLEETMEQLSKMHLGGDRDRVEGRKAREEEGGMQGGGQGEEVGGKDEGTTNKEQRRKFVDLQAALGGQGQSWDSDDEDETADSTHTTTVKSTAEPSVQIGAKDSLVAGSRARVSSAPHNRTDQEKLSAVRERLKQDTPRKVQVLSIDESLKLQVEQQRREEELRMESAAARLMETVGTVSIGMPPRAGRADYRDTAVSSVEAGEEDGDSVSDPSDLSSEEDDLVGEEIHF